MILLHYVMVTLQVNDDSQKIVPQVDWILREIPRLDCPRLSGLERSHFDLIAPDWLNLRG